MEIRITTLSENTANFGFLAEWGISILVEVNKIKILLDTGMSHSLVHNAQILGVDLRTIDWVVLSHAHPDHTGGLREFLMRKGKCKIIGHPDIWANKHVRFEPGKERYNGIPFPREELESLGAEFIMSKEPFFITDHIMTTGEIPMVTDYEDIDDRLFVKEGGKLKPDTIADDLALIINADSGLVVILGCAHRGVVNILHHARNLTGIQQVYAVVGGTHLFRASRERIEKTANELKMMGVQKLAASHCTGFHAACHLSREFGDKYFLNNAGTSFTLP
ncbi:MAG: MBL fold metallo-hydrolase [Dehalococcoidales bacterium]